MLFNSMLFLFIFLPIAFMFYFIVPDKCKNIVLLIESILFYAWGAFSYLPLLIILILIHYFSAIWMEKTAIYKKNIILAITIILDVGILSIFKYGTYIKMLCSSFIEEGIYSFEFLDLLPLGISYYLFKLISYMVDVKIQKCEVERNIIAFSVYVMMFPQLLVGPIVRYVDVKDDLHNLKNRCTLEKINEGAELFIIGLAKKVVLADSIGLLWLDLTGKEGIGLEHASSLLVWLGVFAFSFQLYFDFSGYSEMSNGLSLMLGIRCKPNFKQPYQAMSITEFWRRWHISLSTWFRDYIYIPLGGNRKGNARLIFNMFFVWIVTGIWHGSSWNFIIWGLYHFAILVIEKSILKVFFEKKHIWQKFYVFIIASIGWAIFAASSETVPLSLLLQKMFIIQDGVSFLYYLINYGVLFLISILACTNLFPFIWKKLENAILAKAIIMGSLFLISIAFVVAGTSKVAMYAGF